MSTETVRITITSAAYVQVTAGHYNGFLKPFSATPFRLIVGQSVPAADATNFVPMSGQAFSLTDLEGSDNVYLRAEATSLDVALIRGD